MDSPKSHLVVKLLVCAVLLISSAYQVSSQSPEALTSGTLREQYEFLQQRTNIYNNFRAIREDMFQRIRQNSLDSLENAHLEIATLRGRLSASSARIDSLSIMVEDANQQRDIAVRERNSMFFMGIPIHKTVYSLIVWAIIAGLLVLMILGGLIYSRNRKTATKSINDLNELKEEFEAYRKKSRERFEQQAIDHFNEIKRLKG